MAFAERIEASVQAPGQRSCKTENCHVTFQNVWAGEIRSSKMSMRNPDQSDQILNALEAFQDQKVAFLKEYPSCKKLIEENYVCQRRGLTGGLFDDMSERNRCKKVAEDTLYCIGRSVCPRDTEALLKCMDGVQTMQPPLYCWKDFERWSECVSPKVGIVTQKTKEKPVTGDRF